MICFKWLMNFFFYTSNIESQWLQDFLYSRIQIEPKIPWTCGVFHERHLKGVAEQVERVKRIRGGGETAAWAYRRRLLLKIDCRTTVMRSIYTYNTSIARWQMWCVRDIFFEHGKPIKHDEINIYLWYIKKRGDIYFKRRFVCGFGCISRQYGWVLGSGCVSLLLPT